MIFCVLYYPTQLRIFCDSWVSIYSNNKVYFMTLIKIERPTPYIKDRGSIKIYAKHQNKLPL